MEEAIAKNNVEPRILDQKLVDNSGWNKIMDVFLAWPRAFYAQKSFIRGRNKFNGGLSHILGFYTAQAMWDAMYTSFQQYARGEDPDKILHEVESDPIGWWLAKSARMPLFGNWSQGAEILVNFARDQSAKAGYDDHIGFGYHLRNRPVDLSSSPASGALNSLSTLAGSIVSYGAGLAQQTSSLSFEDRQAQQVIRSGSKILPGANNLLSKMALELFYPSQQRNAMRGRVYYELQQMRKDMDVMRKRIRAQMNY